MVRNLRAAGATLTLYNRSAGPLDEFAAKGMTSFTTAKQLTGDTFIMMVRDSPAVEAVITGTDGLLECVTRGKLVIDMGSTNLDVTRRMAEAIKAKGGDYLDAPVSGGEIGAIAGSLTIMVGGNDAAFARASADIREAWRPRHTCWRYRIWPDRQNGQPGNCCNDHRRGR